jgi:hypothetical protein
MLLVSTVLAVVVVVVDAAVVASVLIVGLFNSKILDTPKYLESRRDLVLQVIHRTSYVSAD